MNLNTGEYTYFSLPPEQAVIAAYAQSRGDWNTWDYGKYRKYLRYGQYSVACGDFSALLSVKKRGRGGIMPAASGYYILFPKPENAHLKIKVVRYKPQRARGYGYAMGPYHSKREVIKQLNWFEVPNKLRPVEYRER